MVAPAKNFFAYATAASTAVFAQLAGMAYECHVRDERPAVPVVIVRERAFEVISGSKETMPSP